MKLTSPTLLGFALVTALAAPQMMLAGPQETSAKDLKGQSCCAQTCTELQDLEKSALAQPAKAGELLGALVARHPEQLETATLTLVGSFSRKLSPTELKPALNSLMQSATALLSSRIPDPKPEATSSLEESRQAQLEQDLRLAAAVQDLTRRAVNAVKENLVAPSQTEADGSSPAGEIVIDPQVYASLMKSSMEQVVKGSLAGLGARGSRIPAAYLPSLAGLRQDTGSYAYSLTETPLAEKIPSALAAPVEEKAQEKK